MVRPSDLTGMGMAIRTHPVRIDIEYSAGRIEVQLNPEELTIGAGDGVEWDFRYFGGADLMVEEVLIEFPKPSPFSKTSFREKKLSAPRHRQLSGPASDTDIELRIQYSIRCFNSFKNEVVALRPRLIVKPRA
jgi:hypothetical protein